MMAIIYEAIYVDAEGSAYHAQVILSPVTLSILFTDKMNRSQQVNWLAERILSIRQHENEHVLYYGQSVSEQGSLVVRDAALYTEITKTYKRAPFMGGRRGILATGRGRLLTFLASVLAFLVLIYFLLLPWIADIIARNISREWEVSLGEKMYESLSQGYEIDSTQTLLANEFYSACGYRADYPVYITVVEEDILNAYALPGGRIVIYSKLLDEISTPRELAALIAHEVAHVQQRHSLRNLTRAMSRRVFLMMILGNDSGMAAMLVENADDLKRLDYSRQLETEADEKGIEMMGRAGIDRTGMLRLMERLKNGSGGQETYTLLSTHPDFEKRISNIERHLSANPLAPGANTRIEMVFQRMKDAW